MKIYFVISEVDPFAKTGGLADVGGALPKALATLGHEVRLVLPLYRQIDRARFGLQPSNVAVSVSVGSKTLEGRVWQGQLPKSRVPVYFLDQPALFDRASLYQEQGKDYPDNLERFSFFSQAALRLLPAVGWQPDVVHSHDWQASLACAQLAFGTARQEPFFAAMGTVLTVHNLAYQGLFPKEQWALTQLPPSAFSIDGLEFYDQINCLKGGLTSADVITTVSPTYAREIQTPEFGCGLDGLLRHRAGALTGILNGIDPEEWNPKTDPHLAAQYSVQQPAGKALCKQALQRSQGLPEQPSLLIGMIQRLAEQKGIDLFVQGIEALLALPMQVVILGTGDPVYHDQLTQLARRFPDRLAVNLKFDNALAHQIEAGADAFLMPSRFEPCGLNQMYSMRFGTVPIARKVGGLADTVVDATPETLRDGTATGFVFGEHSARALVDAVTRAVRAYQDQALWTRLRQAGMQQDHSWDRSARAYVGLYERARAAHAQPASA